MSLEAEMERGKIHLEVEDGKIHINIEDHDGIEDDMTPMYIEKAICPCGRVSLRMVDNPGVLDEDEKAWIGWCASGHIYAYFGDDRTPVMLLDFQTI